MTSPVNILWLDDDLKPLPEGLTQERERLQPWLRLFKRFEEEGRIRLIEAEDPATFRQELSARHALPVEHPDFIHLILIDVFWRQDSSAARQGFSFIDQVFAGERVLPVDAGVQMIGLLRNDTFATKRPAWMAAYSKRRVAILTTLRDNWQTLHRHIDQDKLSDIDILVKDLERIDGDEVPDADFRQWLDTLVAL